MFIRIARRYEFVVVTQVQIFYRLSNRSSSASLDRQAAECLKVIHRSFQASPPPPPTPQTPEPRQSLPLPHFPRLEQRSCLH
ncbi:MAG: hypothetical protein HC916_16970 [Coleofasciculaceae cyanobacterium SM2_1_6]|nr:hypothetical protein [Coleofasciculaceae cyanobacterium SM2_1_6]